MKTSPCVELDCVEIPPRFRLCVLASSNPFCTLDFDGFTAQLMYEEGRGGVDASETQAFYWFSAAAAQVREEIYQ